MEKQDEKKLETVIDDIEDMAFDKQKAELEVIITKIIKKAELLCILNVPTIFK